MRYLEFQSKLESLLIEQNKYVRKNNSVNIQHY